MSRIMIAWRDKRFVCYCGAQDAQVPAELAQRTMEVAR